MKINDTFYKCVLFAIALWFHQHIMLQHVNAASDNMNEFKDAFEAKSRYEQAIRLDPYNVNAHIDLATLMENRFENYDEAKQLYERALQLDANNERAYLGLAFLEDHLKNYGKAKQLYEKVCKMASNPTNAFIAHYNLALLMQNHFKDYDAAKQLFEKAIPFRPRDESAYYSLAHLMETHFQNYDAAIQLYQKVTEIIPNDPTACIKLAHLMETQLKNYDAAKQWYGKAKQSYNEATQRDPDNAYAWYKLANLTLILNKNEIDETVDLLEEAVSCPMWRQPTIADIDTLESIEKLFKKICNNHDNNDNNIKSRCYQVLGQFYMLQNQFHKAKISFDISISSFGDENNINAHLQLCKLYSNENYVKSDHSIALFHCNKAYQLATESQLNLDSEFFDTFTNLLKMENNEILSAMKHYVEVHSQSSQQLQSCPQCRNTRAQDPFIPLISQQ